MMCRTCGTQNPDGLPNCSLCGASLNQTIQGGVPPIVGGQSTGGFQAAPLTSSPPAVQPAATPTPQPIASSTQTNYLVPVLPSGEEPSLAFELPAGLFNFLVGRMDLGSGIVPTVAVEAKWPTDFIKKGDSWLFSRKTANVRRDGTTGQLFLAVDPDCGVVVLIAQPGSTDFVKILPGDEIPLNAGATLMFGYRGNGARVVVR